MSQFVTQIVETWCWPLITIHDTHIGPWFVVCFTIEILTYLIKRHREAKTLEQVSPERREA